MTGKYYFVADGERRGPFRKEELEAQTLTRETLVWRKGMPDWLPAGRVAELLDVFDEPPPVPGAVPAAIPDLAVPPSTPAPPPAAAAPAESASEHFKDPTVNIAWPEAPAHDSSSYGDDSREVPPIGIRRIPYDRVGMRRLYLASSYVFVPGLILVLASAAAIAYLASQGPGDMVPRFDANRRVVVNDFDPATRQFRMFLAVAAGGGMLFGVIGLIVGIACYSVLLYRAWALIQDGRLRPTPGRAVGFLFIPFFNTYWFFVAVFGLARALNRCVRRYDLDAPTASQALGFAIALYLAMMYLPIPFAGLVPLGLLLIVLPFYMRSIYQTSAAICDEANQDRIAQAPRERVLCQPDLSRPVSAHMLSMVAIGLAPIGTAIFVIAFGINLHALQHYRRDLPNIEAHRAGIEQLRKQGALNGQEQNVLRDLQQRLPNLEHNVHRWSEELVISGVVLAGGLIVIGLAIGLAMAAGHCARASEDAEPQAPPAWPLSQGAGLLAKNARSP
jgi:hypothetical protein